MRGFSSSFDSLIYPCRSHIWPARTGEQQNRNHHGQWRSGTTSLNRQDKGTSSTPFWEFALLGGPESGRRSRRFSPWFITVVLTAAVVARATSSHNMGKTRPSAGGSDDRSVVVVPTIAALLPAGLIAATGRT